MHSFNGPKWDRAVQDDWHCNVHRNASDGLVLRFQSSNSCAHDLNSLQLHLYPDFTYSIFSSHATVQMPPDGPSSPRLCTEQHLTDALVFPGACRPCAGGPTAAAFAPYLAHKAACNEVVLQRYRAESRTVHLPCSRASGETAATQKLDVHPSIACDGLVCLRSCTCLLPFQNTAY